MSVSQPVLDGSSWQRRWRHLEKEVKKTTKKLKRLVVQVDLRRIFSSFMNFVRSLLTRVWVRMNKLKGKETGLGWDHEKGNIAASDEWWLKKIEMPSLNDVKIKELTLRPVEEDVDSVYVPSQPHTENIINQPFNIENNDTSILGPRKELWHDDFFLSTPPPVSKGVDGGGNGKDTNGPRKMGPTTVMHEKLDAILEVIISEKKTREVKREEIMIETLERREERQRKEMNN
ncbi:hypothetical protein Cgig2_006669 [Carnegiea gigantea]|uniref:Myb/SANT-like domain-containing protein n=1 Tax=Carnegiea gigantea TaxID=171969 RepID=A0A9Q1JYU7_9CARY|nr:hypothetical protein Cgig2_006669 [Carnegiea gigantea]